MQFVRFTVYVSFIFILFEQVVSEGNCGKSPGPFKEGNVSDFRDAEDAEQGTWPWMVAITKKVDSGIQLLLCTGFLIDKKHVISTAHCFDSEQVSLYSARIGNVDLTKGDEYTISNIAVHEDYKPGRHYNDIALITLSKDVDIPDFVPVCLPSSRSAANLTGRGTTLVAWGGRPDRNALKELSAIPVVSNNACEERYKSRIRSFRRQFPEGISSTLICAGFLDRENKCGKYSGGPLMMQEDGSWYAVGIASFGYRCGGVGYPDGYTKVSEFIDWINDKIQAE